MSLLLDTHIWLWSLEENASLTPGTVALLQDKREDLWLSPVSIWETLLLIEKGRLLLSSPANQWLQEVRAANTLREATLNNQVMWELREVSMSHADPADRFLVATARVYDLTLVTADERILNAKACKVFANR